MICTYLWKISLAVFVPVIIGVIGVIIGYKLNDYLSRDNISIQRVDFIPETSKLPYPSKAIMELNQNPRFQNYLISQGHSTIYLFNHGFYNQSFGKPLQTQVDQIITVLRDLSKFDEELQLRENEALQNLERGKQGSNSRFIFANLRYIRPDAMALYALEGTEMVTAMIKYIENEKTYIKSANESKNNILRDLKEFKPERTGLVKINVILLNSGDTDGLVK